MKAIQPTYFKSVLIFTVILALNFGSFAQLISAKPLTKAAIESALEQAYQKFKNFNEGNNADYIPALAQVDSKLFAVALVTLDGTMYVKGDTGALFSIQSISKVFTLAKVIEDSGMMCVARKIGVDPTGQVFNSINAVEQKRGEEMNPFVNPGAIATTSLIIGNNYEEKWQRVLDIHNQFAGRSLSVNEPVYTSEAATNQRNQAIAMLLKAYDRIYFNPLETTDIYTKQCALNVNAKDLAVMAATLANGGYNPITKKQVVSPKTVSAVLPVMATCGLYDNSGQWLFYVGMPAKSGVGGGIIAVDPGRFGIAVFSPRLDKAGNSVRAQRTIYEIMTILSANPYLIQPQIAKK